MKLLSARAFHKIQDSAGTQLSISNDQKQNLKYQQKRLSSAFLFDHDWLLVK